ncbi:MAG: putative two-component histidine kinase [Gemmatimonadetes bacterium]|nr:putative two-component histidine kinase [Gemmatimonadota bacterium]
MAVLALAVWLQQLTPRWLVAAALLAAVWAVGARSAGRAWRAAGALAFVASLSIGAGVQFRLGEIARDWRGVRAQAEDRAAADLNDGLDDLLDRAETAVKGAAEAATRLRAEPGSPPRGELFGDLSALRRANGISALAVFGPDGAPLAWSGEHRGGIPEAVRLGQRRYSYSSGPLFGYLYFTRPFGGGRTAVAAVLLEAHVALGEGGAPFADRFAADHGITPRFTTPDRAQGASVWDWTAGSKILSVVFATLTQERWRDRVADRGRWVVTGAWLAAALLLGAAWFGGRGRSPAVPVAVATGSLLVLPLGEMLGTEGVFSPLSFVLPGPGDLTLGRLVILLAGAAVWLLSRSRPGRWTAWMPLWARIPLAGGALAGAAWLVRGSVAAGVLAAHPAGGLGLAGTLTILAALPLYVLLSPSGRSLPRRTRMEMGAFALALAAVMGVALVLWWRPGRELPWWSPALWALPFGLLAAAVPRARTGRGALLPWVAVGWIAGTMALPHLWLLHLDARLDAAEQELSQLGTRADPFLDFLLRQFAEKVLFRAAEGREGVSLLYQSWVEADLARQGYEARLTLWDGSEPAAELQLSDQAQIPPSLVPGILASARAAEEPLVRRYTQLDALHYLLAVPLPGGRTVTVAVPPRRHLGRSTALSRFLDPAAEGDPEGGVTSLSLVPAAAAAAATPPGGMRWIATREGWRSEAMVEFPAGTMHAHLLVQVPTTPLLAVRAVLSLVAVLLAAALLWSLARTLCGEPFGLASGEWGWIFTFRGRLTLALFAFFLLPMAAFGATTYRTLSKEVVHTSEALAERALTEAATEIQRGPLGQIGPRVGADLLLYHRAVLVEGTTSEVIDLGLYPTWIPSSVYLDFTLHEGMEGSEEERRLAGQRYLVVYRRLGAADVLAAPTPLATGEIARRQRELASVVLVTVLMGAGLSVVLSLLVGRALSRPIEGLTRAAAAVGEGNLSVRLPGQRRDEFGGLYRSFNRMVRGLRHTRAELEGEKRRTEAIVEEAGTGVVALDGGGRVALINPRAERILGVAVPTGARIPQDRPLPALVALAVARFLASGEREWAEEREVDGRVLRLRLRRLPVAEGARGAVLVVEDVTAEIRSARVLAWGEMARQVAHEIKNPLTPIKLAVQHIRRAHADRRDDFGQILDRNVDAVLREIDSLGEIARAFARFGAPQDAAEPAEPVDVRLVAEETLALYRGGRDGIAYTVDVAPDVPRAFARVGELKEVLVNLLENARAALNDTGGAVRIAAALAGGGAWVRLDVSDTGEGIPPELVARVFDPHFSTRSSGTGLGLAIVRRLAESWGGEVTVDSEPGVGTTVHLRLRAEETTPVPSPDPPPVKT